MTNPALENLLTRRSVRAFTDRPVEKEKLDAIMEAAIHAPTGLNRQSPTIVVVRDKETVAAISRMNAKVMNATSDPFYGASTVAIVFGNKAASHLWLEDACMVIGNLLNAAHAVGVDSCYINRAREVFATEEGLSLLRSWGLDENYVGVANCILGYGAGDPPQPKPRKDGYVKFVD